jgi:hypothetical protein
MGDKLPDNFHFIWPGTRSDVSIEYIPGIPFNGFSLQSFCDGIQNYSHAPIGPIVGVIKGGDNIAVSSPVGLLKQFLGSSSRLRFG